MIAAPTGRQSNADAMKELPIRIALHLRPAVRRLTIAWLATLVIVATMSVSMAYNVRMMVGIGWLAVMALGAYGLMVLRRLRA
jgi:hypothetical protein